jgi:CRISPR-associated protein Cmr6
MWDAAAGDVERQEALRSSIPEGVLERAVLGSTPEQAAKYCGKPVKPGDWAPGSLRFQGGYPVDTEWTSGLVDVVHPQQAWQTDHPQPKKAGAFVQSSLYKHVAVWHF